MLPACTGDKRDSAWWANEKTIIELRNDIQLAKYNVQQMPSEKFADTTDSAESCSDLRDEVSALSISKNRLSGEILEMKNNWEGFRRSILGERRSKTTGLTFNSITTTGGRTYDDVTISRIDDGGVSLRHRVGTARLRLEDLDQDRQAFFGLDREFALTAHEKESKRRMAYNQWVSKGMAAADAKQEKLDEERRKEEKLQASERALTASLRAARSTALSSSVGSLGETRTVSTGRRYSTYGSYGRTRTRYYYPTNTSSSCPPTFGGYTNSYRPAVVAPVTQVAPVTSPVQCPTSNPFAP